LEFLEIFERSLLQLQDVETAICGGFERECTVDDSGTGVSLSSLGLLPRLGFYCESVVRKACRIGKVLIKMLPMQYRARK
jgi:hypothetical protein